ncbi:MAG: hypothetical protein J5752_04770 [Clostridiales bacterium]|nr:hypothetical protein [Clostridiales bacterium]
MKNRNIIYRIVAAAMSLSLMLGAAACKKKIPFKDKSTVALADKDSVKFDMSVEKVGSRKILVTLTNKSDTTYLAGQMYSLEYKDGKDWYQVPAECIFTMEAYLLAPAGDPELSNNWSQKLYLSDYCKETLPAGHYRVIKSVMQDVENSEEVYLAAEFDLEKEVSDPQEKSTITDDQIISADQYVLPVSGVELGIVNEMKIKVATARLMRGERSFILEYKQDGIWYTKEIKGYGGECDSSAEYGQLDLYPAEAFAKGTYRLLQEQSKDSSGKTLYACYEFTI